MPTRMRWFCPALALAFVLAASSAGYTQADPTHFKFSSGQAVQPIFEGWSPNPDGSFEMHFGYLNRNYVEELHLPIGPDNQVTPGGPDSGQPTFFYPHISHRSFSVTVPADFGDKELIWTLTVRDETNRAIGWLLPEWEIFGDPSQRGYDAEEEAANQPPTLSVDAARSASLGETLTMTASVTDDGLPEPRARPQPRAQPPTLEPDPEGTIRPVNVPQLLPDNRKRPTRTQVDRVNLTWTQWRGPIGVTVEPDGEPENGVSTVAVTFDAPGDYVFHVRASDGAETVGEEIAITVR
jgi:hypothetical protein